jgi:hypothetical protein
MRNVSLINDVQIIKCCHLITEPWLDDLMPDYDDELLLRIRSAINPTPESVIHAI